MNDTAVGARATEAVNFFIRAVEQIPSQSWDLPSNLEGWSIGDLVSHTTGTVAKIVTLVEGGQPKQGPADPDDWRSENPAAQLRELAGRLHDVLVPSLPSVAPLRLHKADRAEAAEHDAAAALPGFAARSGSHLRIDPRRTTAPARLAGRVGSRDRYRMRPRR